MPKPADPKATVATVDLKPQEERMRGIAAYEQKAKELEAQIEQAPYLTVQLLRILLVDLTEFLPPLAETRPDSMGKKAQLANRIIHKVLARDN